jgi:hypothetical protein
MTDPVTALEPTRPFAERVSDAPDRAEFLVLGAAVMLVMLGLITGVLGSAWLFATPALAALAHVLCVALGSTSHPSPDLESSSEWRWGLPRPQTRQESSGETVVLVTTRKRQGPFGYKSTGSEEEFFSTGPSASLTFDRVERLVLRGVAARTDDDPEALAKDLDLSTETVRDTLARVRERLGTTESSSLVGRAAELQRGGLLQERG